MTAPLIPLPRSEAMALRAALYGRASSDPKKRGRSIKDQFEDGEAECLDRGWTVVGRYEDRDRSASRRARRRREDWERLLADVEAGQIDVIVYAERTRASRELGVSIKLRSLCRDTGVLLYYDGRVYNMNKPADFRDFTRDAVASEEEGETTIMRAERTARLNAHRGAPHGKAAFGYARQYDSDDGHLIGQVPHPDHADVVRDLFKRAAARQSLNSLILIYREHVPDATRAGLRYLLKNRTYLGERTHKGTSVKAEWPALITLARFQEVGAILDEPDRRTQKDVRAKHLLSGIARCSMCVELKVQQPFVSVNLHHSATANAVYRCTDGATHTHVNKAVVEAYVEESLLKWLARPESALTFTPAHDAEELTLQRNRLAVLQMQLANARKAAGEIDPATGLPGLSVTSLASVESAMMPQAEEAKARIQQLSATADPLLQSLLSAGPDGIDADWDGLGIEQKRHVVRKVANVFLHPAERKGVRHFDYSRIRLVFADEPGFEKITSRKRLQA